jgi:hypothetical protein
MEHFNSDRALTGNIALVPKLFYYLATRCSGLEYGSSLIWLNCNALEPFHVDLYTGEGRQGRCYSMTTIPHEELEAIVVTVFDL